MAGPGAARPPPTARGPAHYDEGYDTKARWASYWHQANEILELQAREVLEIGVGNRFLSTYLRRRGVHVLTLDIEPKLAPDVAGSVLRMPFRTGCADVVACFQVLEHLPFVAFPKALKEMARVARRHVVLSLPDATSSYRFYLHVPGLGEVKRVIPLPIPPRAHSLRDHGQHYWEIGKRGYPLKRVRREIGRAGLTLAHTFRVFEHPYHRFFILQKEAAR